MTPGTLPIGDKLKIHRGTSEALELIFTDDETGDPIDLSGMSFVAQVRLTSRSDVLFNMVVDETDLANGVVTLSWTKALTDNIPIAKYARWGLLDATDQLWIEDTCEILDRTPSNN